MTTQADVMSVTPFNRWVLLPQNSEHNFELSVNGIASIVLEE